jgi:hypothetical protein
VKRADIEVGKRYVAEIERRRVEVEVLAVDAPKPRAYRGINDASGTIRVRLCEVMGGRWGVEHEEGAEATLLSRRLLREWSEEDEAARIARAQEDAARNALRLRFEALGLSSGLTTDQRYARRDAATLARREGREPDVEPEPRLAVRSTQVTLDRAQFERLLDMAEGGAG